MLGGIERTPARHGGRPGAFGCFGLHEWAMVYREGEHRHPVPLRLGQAGTDDVVETHKIRCTHIDAFRFFTPDAAPRNRCDPTRETQPEWSSRAACTPGWTCTSGPSSSDRWCRASCCSTLRTGP